MCNKFKDYSIQLHGCNFQVDSKPLTLRDDARYTQRMLIDEINENGFDGAYAGTPKGHQWDHGTKTLAKDH